MSTSSSTLNEEVAAFLQQHGLHFKHIHRVTKLIVEILFTDSVGRFWSVKTAPLPVQVTTPVELDRALYKSAVAKITDWIAQNPCVTGNVRR